MEWIVNPTEGIGDLVSLFEQQCSDIWSRCECSHGLVRCNCERGLTLS